MHRQDNSDYGAPANNLGREYSDNNQSVEIPGRNQVIPMSPE